MKMIFSLLMTALAVVAQATPNQDLINQTGLEILLANSERLKTDAGKSVASYLANWLVTDDKTHNKISNSCLYDILDEEFKCTLFILNSDDQEEERTESSLKIQYILEQSESGLPSRDLFYLSVVVEEAG